MRIRSFLFLIMILCFGLSSKAQTKEELLRMGNDAWDEGNFASAAYFYNRIATGSNSGIEEIVYPYDLKHSNRVHEEKVDTLSSDTTATDSLNLEAEPIETSDIEINRDTSGTGISITEEEVEIIYIYHRLAEAYRRDFNYDHAEPWYEKAVKSPHPEFPIVTFRYGEILMNNEKYEEARDQFSEFITNAPAEGEGSDMRDAAKQKMRSCNYALQHKGNVKGALVEKLDSNINNGTAVFGATYFGSEAVIAYSSATIYQTRTAEHETYDLYTSLAKEDGHWDDPDRIPEPASSDETHEGSICITPNGNRMYFTKWDGEHCAIYASNNFNGKWMEPFQVKDINIEGVRSMNPNLSPDGNNMYFSSNREGGYGGMDIWKCKLDQYGNPRQIENMGEKINSPGDEISPFMHPNNEKLFFSSNGHIGFGGYDIFHSDFHEEYGWSPAINLGHPFNSSRDDSYYITSHDGKHGFFSSDRESCDECGHGNCLKLYYYDNGPPRFFLDGFVFDSDTDMEIPGAKITIKDVKKDSVIMVLTADETGYYSADIEINKIYFIKGQHEGYFGDANSVSTIGAMESKSYMVDLYLTPIPLGEIDIPGIEYDYDMATLRDTSKIILDELYEFLVLNDNLKVELRSHTDDRGTHEYNMDLSQRRAQSCVDYLVERGINIARIVPVGFGETDPKVPNAQTEEDHQRNRRTAFFVVGQHFHE